MDTISSINDTLNEAEYLLNNDFVTDNLTNLTAYADEQLVNVRYTLADVETMVSNLNLSDTGGECTCTSRQGFLSLHCIGPHLASLTSLQIVS